MQQYPAAAGPVPVPSSQAARVRLYFAAEGFEASHTYVVVTALPSAVTAQQRPVKVGRTETSTNGHAASAVWANHVEVDFHFEQRQDFTLAIHHDDHKGPAGDGVVARGNFTLAQVVSARRSTLQVPLDPLGKITITSEPCPTAGSSDTIQLTFAGKQFKKMNVCGWCDPYFKLSKKLPNGTVKLLYQSPALRSAENPVWACCPQLPLAEMTVGSDWHAQCLLFECWDENTFKDGKMGRFECSLQQLIDAHETDALFTLRHATKDKSYGHVAVTQATITRFPSFIELLQAGLQLNLAVSIDFTGSNGDPMNPNSLHHINARGTNNNANLNQYECAILSVGEILMEYDSDKLVPAFGFGAELPNSGVSHCFHLNRQQDPHVHGLDELLEAYRETLRLVKLSGPTNFAPTVRQATAAARASAGTYTILLIITDGCITDTDQTIEAIVDAGDAPLSIIIVGVGSADFTLMDVLDGDDERLTNSRGVAALRDLVQFVPFRDFARAPRPALAAEVLQEVPHQVAEWARLNRVRASDFGSQPAKH